MHLLKRFELWALLVLIVAGLAWVFMSGDSEDNDASSSGSGASTSTDTGAALILHRAVLKRDHGNARLDLEVRARNDSGETLVMQPPKVRLVTGSGRNVPDFFLPFEPRPEVTAGSTQDVQLRFWLEAADLKEALTLEVDGKALPVKSAKPFDLDTLENGAEKVFASADW